MWLQPMFWLTNLSLIRFMWDDWIDGAYFKDTRQKVAGIFIYSIYIGLVNFYFERLLAGTWQVFKNRFTPSEISVKVIYVFR